jgi:type VI secretion system secreted protein VgrG
MTMAPAPLQYVLELGDERLAVDVARGTEEISQARHLEVELSVPWRHAFDPEAACGQPAVLVLMRNDDVRRIRLVVSEARRAAASPKDPNGVRIALRLEARLSWLRHRVDFRVFRDRDVPTIVSEVLGGLGVPVERRLRETYAVRPYTVQCRESDHDFAKRLLEDEGIFFFISDDDVVVLGDAPTSYDDAPAPLPWRQRTGLDQQSDAVFDLGARGHLGPGSVTSRDFDFERPSLDVTHTASVPLGASTPASELYDYPSGRTTPGGAATKAQKQAEAFACSRDQVQGRSFAGHLRPGLVVSPDAAPAGLHPGPWVLVEVRHDFRRTESGFSVGFCAIDAAKVARPEPRTPVPRWTSPMTGFVTGPPGEDIHTDAWGRTKIHFPWDRLQPKDDTCSDWIPTLQDNTGRSSTIPRIGWEMLVHFIEGDPDRPIIMGRVYNGEDPPFASLPGSKTTTTIRSLTSPREGDRSDNRLTFEDLVDAEAIFLHAERDHTVQIDQDKTILTGSTDGRAVHGHEVVAIGKNRDTKVAEDATLDVKRDMEVAIGAQRTTTIGEESAANVGGNRTTTIGGSHLRRLGSSDTVTARKGLLETIGALVLEASVRDNTVVADQVSVAMVGGAMLNLAKETVSQTTGKLRSETIGGLLFTKAKKLLMTRVEGSRVATIGSSLSVDAGEDALLTGQSELVVAMGSGTLKASKSAVLKVQNTKIELDPEKSLLTFDSPVIAIRTDDRTALAALRSKQND